MLYRNPPSSVFQFFVLVTLVVAVLPLGGCAQFLATGVYFWEGGNFAPAECNALDEKRVVVFCRSPSASEYSYAGAARDLSRRVSRLLAENVPNIDVVNPREVDNWIDVSDGDDCLELGEAVKADLVVEIDLENFNLREGKTLYHGRSDVSVSVYDVHDRGQLVWDKNLGELLFPRNNGIPAQDKSEQQFQREYVGILATEISVLFYRHDPHVMFAIDALANR